MIIANGGVDKIRGIGIGAPNGNYYTGTIEFAPNLPWKGILPLAAMFEERLGIPTALTNDANAAAIGEMTYGAARGMKDFINLNIEQGEFVSIMGASGSGKSTLLNILGILDNYDTGEYYLNNVLIKNLSETKAAEYRNRMIGFIFQSFRWACDVPSLLNPDGRDIPRQVHFASSAYPLIK